MDPEIIKAALQQVLDSMGGAAKNGLANKLMGGGKPLALGADGTTDNGDEAPPPPDMMAGAAGEAAAGDSMPPDDVDGDEMPGKPEEGEPSDEELEEMLKGAK